MVRNSHLSAIVLASACCLALAFPSVVRAWESRIEGGPGGGPFRIQCPNNGFIVGFEGRSGAYIDHFRIICGAIDARTMQLQWTGPLNINIGTSGGGGPAYADCPHGWAVNKIEFELTWRDYKQNGFVHHINFHCRPPRGLESIWRTYGPPGPAPAPSTAFFSSGKFLSLTSQHDCPPDELAVGLQGRSGLYVDALGLICAPIPKPVISPGLPDRTTLAPARPGGPLSARPFADPAPPAGSAAPPAAPPPPLPGMQGQQPVDDQGRMAMRQTGFTGNWHTFTDKNWTYQMSLRQDGTRVTGTYVAQNGANGRITGRVRGEVLEFTWTQDGGFKGTGQFSLSPNGNSFSGVYRSDPHPSIRDPRYLQGTWNGTRR